MTPPFTPIIAAPRNFQWGEEGDLWYQGPDGYWVSIPHPGIAGQAIVSTEEGWETGEATGGTVGNNIRRAGFGCQFGDGFSAIEGTGFQFLVHAPYNGSITRIILRANASCNAVVDVRRNGTSIFTGTAVKPTLAGAAVDDKTDLTDVTTDVAMADQYLFVLNTASGNPTRLSVTVFVLKENA